MGPFVTETNPLIAGTVDGNHPPRRTKIPRTYGEGATGVERNLECLGSQALRQQPSWARARTLRRVNYHNQPRKGAKKNLSDGTEVFFRVPLDKSPLATYELDEGPPHPRLEGELRNEDHAEQNADRDHQ